MEVNAKFVKWCLEFYQMYIGVYTLQGKIIAPLVNQF